MSMRTFSPYATLPSLPYQVQALPGYNNFLPLAPIERGTLMARQRNDFFRNLWGVPEDLARLMDANQNMQPMDIIGAYKDRVLEVPSQQLTAMLLNSEASFLSETISPIFPTAEFNFQGQFQEMNMIEFDRTAEGGIPSLQTYRTASWSDKVEKVQKNAQISTTFAQDPNVGERAWLFQLAGLAAGAMLTVHKTIAYALVRIGYENLVSDYMKPIPFDYSKALASEEYSFGLAALDQTRYLQLIREKKTDIRGLNTAIIPFNSVHYIAAVLGESTSMQAQKIITDPTSGELLWRFTQGKRSVGTVQYGEDLIHFVEMPEFRVNMDDDRKEQALRTVITVGQVYPPNPDIHANDSVSSPGALREENLDLWIYEEFKSQGDEVRISMRKAYANCFYWDDKTKDGLSKYAHGFADKKNRELQVDNIPWEYNPTNPHQNKDLTINTEPEYGNNSASPDLIVGKADLLSMRGWRDRFFGLTWVPAGGGNSSGAGRYRLPKRIADFELKAIPNAWIGKYARAIAAMANQMVTSNVDFDEMMDETLALLDDIDNAPWSDSYVNAVRERNAPTVGAGGGAGGVGVTVPTVRTEKRENWGGVEQDEWRANRFGSLDLPPRPADHPSAYPPGFSSAPGIETLAREADNEDSTWAEAGKRAKRVNTFLDMLERLIREYIGQTDLTDPNLTPPWYQVKSGKTVLVASLRAQPGPVYLSAGDNGEDLPEGLITPKAKFAAILDAYTASNLGSSLVATQREEPVLNKLVNHTLQSVYYNTPTDFVLPLTLITDIALRLNAALLADESTARLGKEIDVISTINKDDKKQIDAVLKRYEALIQKPNLAEYADNVPATKTAIANLKATEGTRKARISELKFYRTPLVAGRSLARSDNKQVLAADADNYYDTPLASNPRAQEEYYRTFASRSTAPSLSQMPYSLLLRLSRGAPLGRPNPVAQERGPSRSMDVRSFLSHGAGFSAPQDYSEMGSVNATTRRQKVSDKPYDPRKESAYLEKEEYFGPMEARMDYRKKLSSPFEQILFMAICMAPNKKDIHENATKLGQKLVNVLIFRPFIMQEMGSTVVMDSNGTLTTAVGHARVSTSSESRGIITINASFYLGIVRNNPQNIGMLGFTFPMGFVAGMNTEFMRDPRHFNYASVEKPSMIAMISPVDETRYEYPLHLLNLPTYVRPGQDNAPYLRKWSSSEFFEYVFNGDELYQIEGHLRDYKKNHGQAYDIALSMGRGVVRYDQNGHQRYVNGTGARGDIRMNIGQAYKTWNGQAFRFPDLQSEAIKRF